MRKSVLPLVAIAACLSSLSHVAIAQEPSVSATPAPSPYASAAPAKLRALTPEERRALVTAGQRAQHDGRVLAAEARVHDAAKAFNNAMVAKDPSLGPILQKMSAENAPGGRHIRLTADEREQLHTAREGMKGTPQDDALQKASTEYRSIASSIMAAAEPSIGPIVARLPQPGASTGTGLHRVIAPSHTPSPSPASSASPSASPSNPA